MCVMNFAGAIEWTVIKTSYYPGTDRVLFNAHNDYKGITYN